MAALIQIFASYVPLYLSGGIISNCHVTHYSLLFHSARPDGNSAGLTETLFVMSGNAGNIFSKSF